MVDGCLPKFFLFYLFLKNHEEFVLVGTSCCLVVLDISLPFYFWKLVVLGILLLVVWLLVKLIDFSAHTLQDSSVNLSF